MNEPPLPSTSATQMLNATFRTRKNSGPKKILKRAKNKEGQVMGGGSTALSEILTKILKTAVQRPLRAWTSLCLRKSRGGGG